LTTAAGADQQATVPRPPDQREVDVMSQYEFEPSMSDQSRIERRCAIIATGSDHFHRIPGTPASKAMRRDMPKFTAWKFILIICIVGVAGFATGGVAISKSANNVLPQMSAAAPRAMLPMCPSLQGSLDARVGAIYERYLGYTPMLRVASR